MNDLYLVHYGVKGMHWGVRKGYSIMNEKYLAHHGVKGQKWGVRKAASNFQKSGRMVSRKYAKQHGYGRIVGSHLAKGIAVSAGAAALATVLAGPAGTLGAAAMLSTPAFQAGLYTTSILMGNQTVGRIVNRHNLKKSGQIKK